MFLFWLASYCLAVKLHQKDSVFQSNSTKTSSLLIWGVFKLSWTLCWQNSVEFSLLPNPNKCHLKALQWYCPIWANSSQIQCNHNPIKSNLLNWKLFQIIHTEPIQKHCPSKGNRQNASNPPSWQKSKLGCVLCDFVCREKQPRCIKVISGSDI